MGMTPRRTTRSLTTMTELERLRAQEAANDEPAMRVAGVRQR